jgi:hypothetical protein
MILMAFQVGGNFTGWSIAKLLKKYSHTSKVVISLHMVWLCVYLNLALRNLLPPNITVDMQNLEFFSGADMMGFIFVNCMLFHDVKWLIFLNGPIFMVSAYFAVLAEVQHS